MKATNGNLSSLIFPAVYRRRVLALLLTHPERRLHVREIARLTGTLPGTLNRELIRLYRGGLLEQEKIGNQVRYSANKQCPIYTELANILRKTAGVADIVADALAPLAENIRFAFVFGSVARGEETAGSDVDILVAGEVGFGQVVQALYETQALLGRDVNPKVYSLKEWQARLRAKDPFVKDVLHKPRIMLIGKDDEPEKSARRKP